LRFFGWRFQQTGHFLSFGIFNLFHGEFPALEFKGYGVAISNRVANGSLKAVGKSVCSFASFLV
jgi:hypothetical protein